MASFIPSVSESDIERILVRDYSVEHHSEIREWIEQVNVREKWRVVAACFKISQGEIEKLKLDLNYANGYWRESIYEAEYPKVKKARTLTKEQIEDKQKKQYLDWFMKE